MASTIAGISDIALLGIFGLFFVLSLFLYFSKRTRKEKRTASKDTKDDDKEKISMSAKIVELENANSDLRNRLRTLEMEYLEKQDGINNTEVDIEFKTKELDEGLKEVYALKEMIEEYRLKFGKLNKEKEELESKVGELTAQLKTGKKKYDLERQAELKKIEADTEDIKKKAKEMVLAYQKETEDKIDSLERKNKTLTEKFEKMKEQYSAWDAIDGL